MRLRPQAVLLVAIVLGLLCCGGLSGCKPKHFKGRHRDRRGCAHCEERYGDGFGYDGIFEGDDGDAFDAGGSPPADDAWDGGWDDGFDDWEDPFDDFNDGEF